MTYRVQIDRLVLDGLTVSPARGPLVQAAVEAELARLITEGGLPPGLLSSGAVPSLLGGVMPTEAGDTPTALGHRIARAVYGGLGT